MATTPSRPVFDLQMEFLKQEVDLINTSIRSMDDIGKSVKQWGITVWTAAVGGAIVTPKMGYFVAGTALIPILFWMVDARYRVIQRRFQWRHIEIKDFLNSSDLAESALHGCFVNFQVMDPVGRDSAKKGRDEFTSLYTVMRFGSLSILYLGLAMFSIVLGLIVAMR